MMKNISLYQAPEAQVLDLENISIICLSNDVFDDNGTTPFVIDDDFILS